MCQSDIIRSNRVHPIKVKASAPQFAVVVCCSPSADKELTMMRRIVELSSMASILMFRSIIFCLHHCWCSLSAVKRLKTPSISCLSHEQFLFSLHETALSTISRAFRRQDWLGLISISAIAQTSFASCWHRCCIAIPPQYPNPKG